MKRKFKRLLELEKTQQLSTVVEQTADDIMITDRNGIIKYVNRAFEEASGFSREELLGKTPRMFKSDHHDDEYFKRLWKTIESGKVFRETMVNKKKNGQLYYVDHTITPIRDQSKEITHYVSIWKDVTDRVMAEEKLKDLNDRLKLEKRKCEQVLDIEEGLSAIVNFNKLVDFVIDKTTEVLEAERCSLMLADKNSGELVIRGAKGVSEDVILKTKFKIGVSIAGLVAQEEKPLLVRNIETDPRFLRKKRPSYKSKSFLCAPIKVDRKLIGIINVADKNAPNSNIFSEIDLKILCMIVRQVAVAMENAKLYSELKYLANTDPLTKLYNYRHFAKSLDHEINRVKRYGGALSLLMVDVDELKPYNDTYGHLEGDKLLKRVAKTLMDSLREVDIVCRYGGDEFVVILPETDVSHAEIVVEKIKKGIDRLQLKRKVTVSTGVAKYTDNMNRYDLILQADAFLYEAKKEKKKNAN